MAEFDRALIVACGHDDIRQAKDFFARRCNSGTDQRGRRRYDVGFKRARCRGSSSFPPTKASIGWPTATLTKSIVMYT